MNMELLIFIGGILLASALVLKVLDWKACLGKLDGLSRQLVWVHGLFIVLVIVRFGVLSLVFPSELATGAPLARGMCLFVASF